MDLKIVQKPLDCNFRGAVFLKTESDGDFYTIVVNSNLSDEAKARTIKHEMLHILNGDFHSERPLNEIEAERHRQSE